MWVIILSFVIIVTILYSYKDDIKIKLFMKYHANPRNDINIDGKVATITFYRSGVQYSLRVPFEPRNRLNQNKMYLIKGKTRIEGETQSEVDITHMPGIPYFLTAEQLNGEYIIFKKLDENKIFQKNEIPILN